MCAERSICVQQVESTLLNAHGMRHGNYPTGTFMRTKGVDAEPWEIQVRWLGICAQFTALRPQFQAAWIKGALAIHLVG